MYEKRGKVFLSLALVAILVVSIFAGGVYYGYLPGLGGKSSEEKLPLFGKIFVSDTSGVAPYTVNFTSLILYYKGNIKYEWDFGDGNKSKEINPTHVYGKSGDFLCHLTVIDSTGEKSSDSIKIFVKANEAPTVQIFLSDLNPSRPFIPLFRRPGMSQYYNGQKFRRFFDSKFFPKSLLNREGFVSCNAVASSPQGNEIVSYEWELRPPTYTSVLGGQKKPVYSFKGQNITIPLFYAYPEAPYDLTAIVTDSKGYKGTSTIKFNVQLNPIETQINSIKTAKETFRKSFWLVILKPLVGGPAGKIIYEKIFPILPSWPLLKLAIISKLMFSWGLNPESSLLFKLMTNLLEKHPILQKIAKKTFEKFELSLEKLKDKHPKLEGTINKLIDTIHQMLQTLGLENRIPELSNEKPAEKSQLVNASLPKVSITVKDPEGDSFNISIHGDYVNNVFLTNQHNNTFNATLITPLPKETDIYWHVNVSDSQGRWVNATYMFTTRW
ncbi:MAG: PKD domain-containing protein [Euryarchaeota archaeon]|nr:PKD domain-containing protein [Euryarchaeota archaeon]